MALTREFRETVMERAKRDPEFRVGLLTEAIDCLIAGDVNVAKSLLRDYVNATLGWSELSKLTDTPPQSLMRMLAKGGNPRMDNVGKILSALTEDEGVKILVNAETKA